MAVPLRKSGALSGLLLSALGQLVCSVLGIRFEAPEFG